MSAATGTEGLHLERTEGLLVLRYRWFGRRIITHLMGVGSVVLLAMLLHVEKYSVSQVLFNPLGIILSSMGIFCSVMILYYLVERTIVRLDAQTLSVRHGPLPWPGSRSYPAAEITSLFVKRTDYGTGGSRKAKSTEFSVEAETKTLGKITVVNGPLSPAIGNAIVLALRDALRIEQ